MREAAFEKYWAVWYNKDGYKEMKRMRTDSDDLWRVIYVAHSAQALESVERMLTDEGFLVRRREVEHVLSGAHELCVLESEAREARQFIQEKGI